jgi:hypothetical protein
LLVSRLNLKLYFVHIVLDVKIRSRGTSAYGYRVDDRGLIRSRGWDFPPCHHVQTGSGALPASYPMGKGAISAGMKRPGREAEHSIIVLRSKNEWSYTSTPQYAFMAWCSVKAQGHLYLYLYIKLYLIKIN